jgi:hypothetical protein
MLKVEQDNIFVKCFSGRHDYVVKTDLSVGIFTGRDYVVKTDLSVGIFTGTCRHFVVPGLYQA